MTRQGPVARWGMLALLAATTATSCAYYNTYYLAKKYYDKAAGGLPYPVEKKSSAVDHENPVPGGGGTVSGLTSMLRITVTVSWTEPTGRRQVTLTSAVPCLRAGCT